MGTLHIARSGLNFLGEKGQDSNITYAPLSSGASSFSPCLPVTWAESSFGSRLYSMQDGELELKELPVQVLWAQSPFASAIPHRLC